MQGRATGAVQQSRSDGPTVRKPGRRCLGQFDAQVRYGTRSLEWENLKLSLCLKFKFAVRHCDGAARP